MSRNELSFNKLQLLEKKYGEAFYILDSDIFETNYINLITEFRSIYPKSNIAYSYKTNYIPMLCSIVNRHGGYAEVVSDMEYQIAKKIGVKSSNIYFNGPYKRIWAVEELLVSGGVINIDSISDWYKVRDISLLHRDKLLNIGIRCNFEIGDGVLSRFGFDVDSEDFTFILEDIKKYPNVKVVGLHTHFASRGIDSWPTRVKGILKIYEEHFTSFNIKFISLGGGLYGNMHSSLKEQFKDKIPTFGEYAKAAATEFNNFFEKYDENRKPELLIEPGSALAGDAMRFIAKTESIKDVRGKKIATLTGSIYNINPTLNKKNPPIQVFLNENALIKETYDLDFAGFTCIESDYLYRGYTGPISLGSYVVFSNVGSYSIVLKPPFILPNYPIIDLNFPEEQIVKEGEDFEYIFKTYKF